MLDGPEGHTHSRRAPLYLATGFIRMEEAEGQGEGSRWMRPGCSSWRANPARLPIPWLPRTGLRRPAGGVAVREVRGPGRGANHGRPAHVAGGVPAGRRAVRGDRAPAPFHRPGDVPGAAAVRRGPGDRRLPHLRQSCRQGGGRRGRRERRAWPYSFGTSWVSGNAGGTGGRARHHPAARVPIGGG